MLEDQDKFMELINRRKADYEAKTGQRPRFVYTGEVEFELFSQVRNTFYGIQT